MRGRMGLRVLGLPQGTSMIRSCSGDTVTRNADEKRLTECQFADDGALLASTRSGAEVAVKEYQTGVPLHLILT